MADFREIYRRLLDEGHRVVSIHVSSKLSGTVNVAAQTKASLGVPRGIEIVDSRLAGGALALLALSAARWDRALFKDWFVDFGPVRAKMAGREPYLPPDVWSLFPDRLPPSELGEIPAGWQVGTVGDVAEQRRDSAIAPCQRHRRRHDTTGPRLTLGAEPLIAWYPGTPRLEEWLTYNAATRAKFAPQQTQGYHRKGRVSAFATQSQPKNRGSRGLRVWG